MKMNTPPIAFAAFMTVALSLAGATDWLAPQAVAQDPANAKRFIPLPDSAMPAGPFGDSIRLGENIFRDPKTYASAYVGNDLRCSNCHLQAGRQAFAAPMWGAYTAYPAYRSKNGHVNTLGERFAECFKYSMNGKQPPAGDPVLVALQSYAYFLAKGLPTGSSPSGRGYPNLAKPALEPDYARGEKVYAGHCASCHGVDGQGGNSAGKLLIPPVWGAHSYNWGAGMHSVKNAAKFIRANMPLALGNTLTVQEAWDVATYINSQVRPQDPRFNGSLAETRKKFHPSKQDMYGKIVNGVLLGDPATTPPAGAVPGSTADNIPPLSK